MIESVMSVMEGDEGMDSAFIFKGRENRFGKTENTQKFLEI